MDISEDISVTQPNLASPERPSIKIHEPEQDMDEEKSILGESRAEGEPGSMTVGIRRKANGTIGSVFSGNKVKTIKKDDGIPLWRKDIQHDFIRAVFEDKTAVFTDVEGEKNLTFSDVYIKTMVRSSKTSKVLKEKLLNEPEQSVRMAMICLLVNLGRMNTTLNCEYRLACRSRANRWIVFPEMRAQLRTYHAIPCLQADQDPNAQYKGLQDAPRLKSILKGACEDTDEPSSIEKIKSLPVPRTNIVNLIFVMSTCAVKITEWHFDRPQDFFDLVIQENVSSKSRAKAFLWLVWWYSESDFSQEAALNNPFGAGQVPKGDADGLPIIVPEMERLTEEEAALENVDTEEEMEFGEEMRLVRKKVFEEDETIGPPVKKTAGRESFAHPWYTSLTYVASPARSEVGRTRENTPEGTPSTSRPRKVGLDEKPPSSMKLNFKASRFGEVSSPAPLGTGSLEIPRGSLNRRSRPETSHQKAVNLNRKMHVDKILFRKWNVDVADASRKRKRSSGISPLYQEIKRVYYLPDDYDSENEESIGPAGLVPNMYTSGLNEEDDFGGEANMHRKILSRAIRRLARDDGIEFPEVKDVTEPPAKAPAQQTNGTKPAPARRSRAKKPAAALPTDQSLPTRELDDLDMDLLQGEGDEIVLSSAEEDDGDSTEDDFSYADPYATLK